MEDAKDVFAFMEANGIGTRVAITYVARATVAEQLEDYQLAHDTYMLGINRNAEPTDVLHKKLREFQRRVRRMWINHTAANPEAAAAALDPDAPETYRVALSRLTRAQARQGAWRDGQGDGENAGAAGRSSRSSARRAIGGDVSARGSAARGVAVRAPAGVASDGTSNAGFAVFVDPGLGPSNAAPSRAAAGGVVAWDELPPVADRRKENAGASVRACMRSPRTSCSLLAQICRVAGASVRPLRQGRHRRPRCLPARPSLSSWTLNSARRRRAAPVALLGGSRAGAADRRCVAA